MGSINCLVVVLCSARTQFIQVWNNWGWEDDASKGCHTHS